MKSRNINKLKPKKFLSLGHHDLPHVGDLTRPYFVTIGCSFTAGKFLEYKETWCSKLSKNLNLQHINLAMIGSSLDYQYNILIEAKKILDDSLFMIWMHTYPTRYHWNILRHIVGDKIARRGVGGNLEYTAKNLQKIKRFTDLTNDLDVLHTNAWGYDIKTKIAIDKTICRHNKKYLLNSHDYLDRASDDLHAGPKSHHILAVDIQKHIMKHFPTWCR